jgi:hypothetical protein
MLFALFALTFVSVVDADACVCTCTDEDYNYEVVGSVFMETVGNLTCANDCDNDFCRNHFNTTICADAVVVLSSCHGPFSGWADTYTVQPGGACVEGEESGVGDVPPCVNPCDPTSCDCLTGKFLIYTSNTSNTTLFIEANAVHMNTNEQLTSYYSVANITGALTATALFNFSGNVTLHGDLAVMDLVQDGDWITATNRTNSKCSVQMLRKGATAFTTWKLIALIAAGVVALALAFVCYRQCCSDDSPNDRHTQYYQPADQ